MADRRRVKSIGIKKYGSGHGDRRDRRPVLCSCRYTNVNLLIFIDTVCNVSTGAC